MTQMEGSKPKMSQIYEGFSRVDNMFNKIRESLENLEERMKDVLSIPLPSNKNGDNFSVSPYAIFQPFGSAKKGEERAKGNCIVEERILHINDELENIYASIELIKQRLQI